MIRLVRETIIKKHSYDAIGTDTVMVETIEQYHYDTEEEKAEHRKQMESNGFTDSGQVREDIAHSMSNPVYVWFGSYYKYTVGE